MLTRHRDVIEKAWDEMSSPVLAKDGESDAEN